MRGVEGPNHVNRPREVDNLSHEPSSQRNVHKEVRRNRESVDVEHETPREDKFDPDRMRQELQLHREDVERLVEELQELDRFVDKGFDYNIHEDTEKLWVEVVDRNNQEVIREIPPEKLLDVVAGIKEVVGLFLDEMR